MENEQYIKYIDKSLKSKFQNIELEDSIFKKEPNNNFYTRYNYQNDILTFLKDRSFFEVEIWSNGHYTMLHEIDASFRNIKISKENIDAAVDFLHNYYFGDKKYDQNNDK